MEFYGKAVLLGVSSYKSNKNKEQELRQYYKYTFLVGDQDEITGLFIEPTVESCSSEEKLLPDKVELFQSIDIKLTLKKEYTKVNGVVQVVNKPSYVIIPKVG